MKNYFRMFVRNFLCAVCLGVFAFSSSSFAKDDNIFDSLKKNVKKHNNGDVIIECVSEKYGKNTQNHTQTIFGFFDYYKLDLTEDDIKEKLKEAGNLYNLIHKMENFVEMPFTPNISKNVDLDETRDLLDEGILIMCVFKQSEDWDFILERSAERKNYESKIAKWQSILKKNPIKNFKATKKFGTRLGLIYGYNKKTKELLTFCDGKFCTLTDKEVNQTLLDTVYFSAKAKKRKLRK